MEEVYDVVDIAADGLRGVAQALHDTSVGNPELEDPRSVLHQVLQTIVLASAEVREAQSRLKPAGRRPGSAASSTSAKRSPRLIPVGQVCPICRLTQPEEDKEDAASQQPDSPEPLTCVPCVEAEDLIEAESSMEMTINLDTAEKNVYPKPSKDSAQERPKTVPAGLPPIPEAQRISVGAGFDGWCKEKNVPELSKAQREGVLYILQCVADRLTRSIEEFRGDAFEVVARFFPPNCDTLAAVTSDELTTYLDGFKDQVQQCLSFGSLNFFSQNTRSAATAKAMNKTCSKRPFGQVAWLRCTGDHKVHVFMSDEDSIRRDSGSGLKCMFCDQKQLGALPAAPRLR